MADVFVSYSKEDLRVVEPLVRALEAYGVSIWWDRSLELNAQWPATIRKELAAAKAVVVCWSPAANVSEWVVEEADLAKSENKYISCLVAQCRPPVGFATFQSADLVQWRQADLGDLQLLALFKMIGERIGNRELSELETVEKNRLAKEEEQRKKDEAARQEALAVERRKEEARREAQRRLAEERAWAAGARVHSAALNALRFIFFVVNPIIPPAALAYLLWRFFEGLGQTGQPTPSDLSPFALVGIACVAWTIATLFVTWRMCVGVNEARSPVRWALACFAFWPLLTLLWPVTAIATLVFLFRKPERQGWRDTQNNKPVTAVACLFVYLALLTLGVRALPEFAARATSDYEERRDAPLASESDTDLAATNLITASLVSSVVEMGRPAVDMRRYDRPGPVGYFADYAGADGARILVRLMQGEREVDRCMSYLLYGDGSYHCQFSHVAAGNYQFRVSVGGAEAEVLDFSVAAAADVFSSTLSEPPWRRAPGLREIAMHVPSEALDKGVSGYIELTCTILSDGAVSCRVTEEVPTGYRFGEAALNLSQEFLMQTHLPDGRSTQGMQVRIPVRFNVE